MRIIESMRDRMSRPIFYAGLRDRILPKIERGELSLDTPLSSIGDSLDLVELTLELEKMKIEIDVPIHTVSDFLWLVKKIEFQKFRTQPPD
jgi:acyl carrier protein